VVGGLKLEKIWARATAENAEAGMGYIMITNQGSQPDRLVRVQSAIARAVQLHTTSTDGGESVMRPLAAGIEIPAGDRAVLRPGAGHPHVMFVGLSNGIEPKKPFKVTLVFENAGPVEVTFRTVAIGANPAHAGH